jgi:glutamine amidotransferase-like uncharacterized protein
MKYRLTELCGRRLGIYTGAGTSHSWLWFVDVLERMGLDNLVCMDEGDLKKGDELTKVSALLISGGDTFAIADGLGREGAKSIEQFISEGGVYFGSCAGAYLPLKSSKYPLNFLNLAGVKISNLSKHRPSPLTQSEKFCTPYGCHYVFHPVRDEVKIRFTNGYSSRVKEEISAPLYGGPCMEPSEDVTPIAFYHGFTDRTLFLVDENLAEETVLGKTAVCSKAVGKGTLYLSGPHLEHPFYPEANELLLDMLCDGLQEKQVSSRADQEIEAGVRVSRELLKGLRRELSGSRIIALALERESMSWLIGNKVYEPEKFRVFIEALWNRLGLLEKLSDKSLSGEDVQSLTACAGMVREKLKVLKTEIHHSSDTTELVEDILSGLRTLASSFMNLYFRLKRQEHR